MPKRTCTISGCDKDFYALGLCAMHWKRQRVTGHPGGPSPTKISRVPAGSRCEVDGCDKAIKCRNLCGTHYQRTLRHGSVVLPVRETSAPPEIECRSCGESLPRDQFSPGRRICLSCRSTQNKRWRAENREQVQRRERQAWWANRDQNLARGRQYRIANREILRAKARMRDAASKRLRYQASNLTQEGLAARVAYYGGTCWICRTKPYEHLDHVKPLAAGGPNLLANIRPACAACNRSKGARWPFMPADLTLLRA